MIPQRAAAVIVQNGKILLMHRIKDGQEYFSLPGGTVESGELPEQTVIRELQEEFTIDIVIDRFLFDGVSMGKHGYYYLVKEFSGTPTLGGEEKRIMTEHNQFHPVWKPLIELRDLQNLYPEDMRLKVADILDKEYASQHSR